MSSWSFAFQCFEQKGLNCLFAHVQFMIPSSQLASRKKGRTSKKCNIIGKREEEWMTKYYWELVLCSRFKPWIRTDISCFRFGPSLVTSMHFYLANMEVLNQSLQVFMCYKLSIENLLQHLICVVAHFDILALLFSLYPLYCFIFGWL